MKRAFAIGAGLDDVEAVETEAPKKRPSPIARAPYDASCDDDGIGTESESMSASPSMSPSPSLSPSFSMSWADDADWE